MNSFIGTSCWRQDIEKKEYARAIVEGIALYILIVWIFYNSWIPFLLCPLFLPCYLKQWMRRCFQKKEESFCMQFRDGINALAAALRVGYSAENALRAAAKDLEILYKADARIRKEFRYMTHQLDMNLSMERVLREFAERIPQEDVETFVSVFLASGRAGGDSIAVVRDTIRILCGKMEVKQEIQTMLAAKQMEFRVMTAVPFGIIFYMRIAFAEFMAVLYGSLSGVLVMSICLAVYLAAWRLGRKFIEIEV